MRHIDLQQVADFRARFLEAIKTADAPVRLLGLCKVLVLQEIATRHRNLNPHTGQLQSGPRGKAGDKIARQAHAHQLTKRWRP